VISLSAITSLLSLSAALVATWVMQVTTHQVRLFVSASSLLCCAESRAGSGGQLLCFSLSLACSEKRCFERISLLRQLQTDEDIDIARIADHIFCNAASARTGWIAIPFLNQFRTRLLFVANAGVGALADS
jgi:hypothetical protein